MSGRRLICIVEGDGECAAVPILVNRMIKYLRRDRHVQVDASRIICTHNGDRITAPHDPDRQLGIEFFVGRAAREKPAGIVVIVDAEDRCMKRQVAGEKQPLGEHLRDRAHRVAGGIPLAVVVANRMFESWFLADVQSLRARGLLLASARLPDWTTPEMIGGCKGWMKHLLGRGYSETRDQPRLAEHISLPLRPSMQRRAPSFWKLFRDINRITREVKKYGHDG